MVTLPTYTDTESPAVAINAAAHDRAIITAYAHDPSMGIHVDAAWRETVFAALMADPS